MKPIDVDELIKAIEQGEGFSWDSHGKDDLCVRKKYIDNAPTIEPFEKVGAICNENCGITRPHGKWEEDSGNIACSHCHTIWLYRRTDFCPNCGADMREDSDK